MMMENSTSRSHSIALHLSTSIIITLFVEPASERLCHFCTHTSISFCFAFQLAQDIPRGCISGDRAIYPFSSNGVGVVCSSSIPPGGACSILLPGFACLVLIRCVAFQNQDGVRYLAHCWCFVGHTCFFWWEWRNLELDYERRPFDVHRMGV